MSDLVRAIEEHSFSFAGATGSSNLTGISDISNAIAWYTSYIDGVTVNDWKDYKLELELLSGPDRVVATRDSSNTDGTATVIAYVVEFNPDVVSVQSGSIDIANASASQTASITAVTEANSFILHSNLRDETGGTGSANDADDSNAAILFNSSTEIQAQRPGGTNVNTLQGTYFVAEYTGGAGAGWTTQEVSLALVGVTSNTATITSVPTEDTFLMAQSETTASAFNSDQFTPWLELTNSTTITSERFTTTANVTSNIFVITFDSAENHTVQRGLATWDTVTEDQTASVTEVDLTKTTVSSGDRKGGQQNGFGTADDAASQWVIESFNSSTQINLDRERSGGFTHEQQWEVVQWPFLADVTRRIFVVE